MIKSVPLINDITTDVVNPPQFVYPIPGRDSDASSPLTYPGESYASLQREGYPDVTTIETSLSADDAFARTMNIVGKKGWQVVQANQDEGVIEATETSLWFGFKDDIVIRITSAEQGSLIDMRSVSRVGKSDLGVNARRIREFMQDFGQSN